MTTYFVLYDPFNRDFAKAGHYPSVCHSLNGAKHFTSEWSAKKYRVANDMFSSYIVKKIQRY